MSGDEQQSARAMTLREEVHFGQVCTYLSSLTWQKVSLLMAGTENEMIFKIPFLNPNRFVIL